MANLPPPPLQSWNELPRPWAQWFLLLWNRVGGSNAVSVDELQLMAMEDAGIEELKSELNHVSDALALSPPTATITADPLDNNESLRAEVASLRMEIEALKQGLSL